ncbi:polyubiquitin-like isoform X2 [Physella acuta]|nr:polyubiquitin-like isoform X2 [Physella acuta]
MSGTNNESGLKITASLCESPRALRRRMPGSAESGITVTPKPGYPPAVYTVVRDSSQVDGGRPGSGVSIHRGNVQTLNEVLGTITIGDVVENKAFQIFVMNFSDSKNYTFCVKKTDLVEHLMKLIQEKLRIPPEQQVLQYAGKNLARDIKLEHYGIKPECTVHLTGRLRGG